MIPGLSSVVVLGLAKGGDNVAKRALAGLDPPPYHKHGPLVSVVIPTFNEEEHLGACLLSLLNQTHYPIEILVVDYHSEDSTPTIASRYATLIRIDEPGVGNARDFGALHAKSDILFFTDADTILEHRLLEECLRDMEDGFDVITVPAVYYSPSPIFQSFMVIHRSICPPWVLSGRATLTHADVWRAVGGWELPIWEERHFGRKLRDAGYKIKVRRDLAVATSTRRWRGQSRAMRLESIVLAR